MRKTIRWWLKMGWRLLDDAGRDNLGIVSAGVAFYAFLAIFPAIAAFMSVYGLITDPLRAEQQLANISTLLPKDAYDILAHEVRTVASVSNKALSVGMIGGFSLALWSASAGTKAMISALNIAYRIPEKRSIFRFNIVALLITLGALFTGAVALLLVAIVPAVMSFFDVPARFGIAITLVRWMLLTVLIAFGVALLYRFAPSGRLHGVPKRRGLTPGAILAALLWLLVSALFSWYAGHFGRYDKTYGSLGAIVVLLMWFSFGAYAVLLGAELDSELSDLRRDDEHKVQSSTTGGTGNTGESW